MDGMIGKGRLALFKRGDIIIIFTVLAAAIVLSVCMLLSGASHTTGELLEVRTPDGIAEYYLSENASFDVFSNGYTLHVRIASGEAIVESCDCPDGFCVRMGSISRAGESVVCVPARVKLTVVGGKGGDDDAIAG